VDITWYGHSCFRLSERGRIAIVTDPFSASIGLEPPKLKADVVTISHDSPGHNNLDVIKGQQPYVLAGPGEYEIGGSFIMGLALHNNDADNPRMNVAYMFDYDGLTVLHLGDLDHVPEQSVIEAVGEVTVLLVPVGGGRGLKASEAADVVALVEPHFVIPMHYALPGLSFELDPVDKFLKAMGVTKVQEAETLKVSSGSLPEQSQVVMLTPQLTTQVT
jgi:L-ascorbate metabolism protein UlaG (beta-lactamase superfamily)